MAELFRLVDRPESPIALTGGEVTAYKANNDRAFGYVGFADKDEFVQFALSPTFLHYYQPYRLGVNVHHATNKSNIVGALQWLVSVLDSNGTPKQQDVLPLDAADLMKKYGPKQDAARRDQFFGSLLFVADKEIQHPDHHSQKQIDVLYREVESNEDINIPVPLDMRKAWDEKVPTGLQPDRMQDRGETYLERYNRIWFCFCTLDRFKAETMRDRLFSKSQAGKPELPTWWLRSEAGPTAGTDSLATQKSPEELVSDFMSFVPSTKAQKKLDCTLTIEHDKELDRHLARLEKKKKKHNFQSAYPVFMCPTLLPTMRRWYAYITELCDLLRVRLMPKTLRMVLYDAGGLRIGEDVVILGFNPKDFTSSKIEMAEIRKHLDDERIVKVDFFCSMFTGRCPEDDRFELPPHLQMYLDYDVATGRISHADPLPEKTEPPKSALQSADSQREQGAGGDINMQQFTVDNEEEATHNTKESKDSDDASPKSPTSSSLASASNQQETDRGAASVPPSRAVLGYASSLPIGWTTGLADLGPEIQAYRDRVAVTPIGKDVGIDPAPLVDYWLYDKTEKWDPARCEAVGESLKPKRNLGANGEGKELAVRRTKFGRILEKTHQDATRFSFDVKKPNGMSHLNQFRTPNDEWQRDRLGPNNGQRDHKTFIDEEYDGFDVIRDPVQRIKWQKKAIAAISQGISLSTQLAGDRSRVGQNYDEIHEVSNEMQEDMINDSILTSDGGIDEGAADYARHALTSESLRIERAVSGSSLQVGPEINLCLRLLNMYVPPGPEGEHKGQLRRYRSKLCPTIDMPLLASQVTGIVHMLIRTCGTFPSSPGQSEEGGKCMEILRQLKYYDGPPTCGGFLEDAPGMGKTVLTLAFFDWWSQHARHTDAQGKPYHKPTLILCPDGYVFRQWVQDANEKFLGIKIIVAKSGDPWVWVEHGNKRFEYVSKEEIESPEQNWPARLDWVWNTSNEDASRTVIISTYSTMRTRIVKAQKIPTKEVRARGKRGKPEDWCYNQKKRRWEIYHITDFWKDRVAMTLCDEAHVLRNDKKQLHWMLRRLNAPIHWNITATPMINGPNDLPSEVKLFWSHAKARLEAHPDYEDLERAIKKNGWKADSPEIWEHVVKTYPSNSDLQLKRLDPVILRNLLRTRDLANIRQYYKHFDGLANIRRSSSSELPIGKDSLGNQQYLSLEDIMPQKLVQTVILRHIQGKSAHDPADELSEYLIWHRMFATQHAEALAKPGKRKKNDPTSIPPNVQPALRRMELVTASTKLARFAHIIEKGLGKETTVANINVWRDKHFTLDDFLRIVSWGNQPFRHERPSRIERLESAVKGSPKLREIIQFIGEQILPDEGHPPSQMRLKKLEITEDHPLIAWYWELVLGFLHVPTQVLHSALEEQEREHIVNSFKRKPKPGDIDHLSVLILMYTISASGVNLEDDCHQVIVSTAASSIPLEIQAWSRVIRVSQDKMVTVRRLCVENSHDEYRDSVQATKAMIDTACKSYDPATLETLAQVLNTFGQREIAYIQDHTKLGRLRKLQYDSSDAVQEGRGGYAPGNPFQIPPQGNLDDGDLHEDIHLGEGYIDGGSGIVDENDGNDNNGGEIDGGAGANSESDDTDAEIFDGAQQDEELEAIIGDGTGTNATNDDANSSEGSHGNDKESNVDPGDINDPDYEPSLEDDEDLGPLPEEGEEVGDDSLEGEDIKPVRPAPPQETLDDDADDVDFRLASKLINPFEKDGRYKQIGANDQTDIYYTHVATLDRNKVYSASDVGNDSYALERGVRLLQRMRCGQLEANIRVTPYINYGALGNDFSKTFQKALRRERKGQANSMNPEILNAMRGNGEEPDDDEVSLASTKTGDDDDDDDELMDISDEHETTAAQVNQEQEIIVEYSETDAFTNMQGFYVSDERVRDLTQAMKTVQATENYNPCDQKQWDLIKFGH